jgi:diguanylate cyclase
MIPCVLVSVGIGFVIGRGVAVRTLTGRLKTERQQLIHALQQLLHSTDRLTSDVDSHNSELVSMEQSVQGMFPGDSDWEAVQTALLTKIAEVLQSNRRMEDDLVLTRYRLEQQAQELDRTRVEARTDSLSGLANRKSFDERLRYVVSQYGRHGKPFGLLLADVDHFKRINDTHGHHAGDLVVARLGETLRELTRDADHVARLGGDEFAIILTDVEAENARRAAARIRAAIEQTNFAVGEGGARVAVTVSIGMAFPKDSDTAETVFQRADQALYRSKAGGRNQLQVDDTVTAG